MKSGIRNNKTLKLVGATSVTLFSLVAVFAASYAWFVMNSDVGGNGMDVQVTVPNGRLKYLYFHDCNSATTSTNLSFNKTPFATYEYDWTNETMKPVGTIQDKWDMIPYASISKDHPMLMIFEYDGDYTSQTPGDMLVRGITPVGGDSLVQHYAETDTNHENPLYTTNGGYLGARKADGSPFYNITAANVSNLIQSEDNPGGILIKQSNDTDYYALSSVTYFRNRTFSNEQYTNFLTQNTGDTLNFPTNTLTVGESFTTINNESDTYLFNQTPCFYKSNGTGTVKYIAVTIEYYVDAIGYIYSTYLGDSGLNHYDSILDFACDWSMEVY